MLIVAAEQQNGHGSALVAQASGSHRGRRDLDGSYGNHSSGSLGNQGVVRDDHLSGNNDDA